MINFLRKYRKFLLPGNRLTRYILYAIGEIVLVVIGILIALQINNWNEERKAAIIEEGYLNGLNSDLDRDQYVQDSIIKIFNFKIENLKGLETELKRLKKEDAYQKAMNYYMVSIGFPEFVSNDHTLETLKSSGNIEAISNKELRSRLLDYYDDVEVYYKTQNAANDIMLNLLLHNHIFDLKAIEDEKWMNDKWKDDLNQNEINVFTNQVFAYRSVISDLKNRLEKLVGKSENINNGVLKIISNYDN
jgi:hypothetical protein